MKNIFTLFTAVILFSTAKAQTFDTTGIGSWPLLTNSYETWMRGAFEVNRDTSDATDFGWGNYDMLSHLIIGDSIYILKTVGGDYKAISIDQFASGIYSVTISNLDKSNKVTKTFDRSSYNTKNFFYYSVDNDQVKDLEPVTASWDVLFTKYLTDFPGFGPYPVAGVLANRNVEVSQVEFSKGGSYSISDTAQFPMNRDISTIGYDWKSAGPNGTVIHDTLVYFVKDQNGNINELKFNGYGGSGNGKMIFIVNGQPDSIQLGAGNVDQAYYSLQSGSEVAGNQDHVWDVAFFAQSSFSSIPVRINDVNGAELYVYPNADINYWNVVSLEENKINILSIYPNPAKDHITIATQAAQGNEYNAQVIDQSGRVVKSQVLNSGTGISEAGIDVKDLSPGIYVVKLSGEGFGATSRLVITP